jgi:hypothetical protein
LRFCSSSSFFKVCLTMYGHPRTDWTTTLPSSNQATPS